MVCCEASKAGGQGQSQGKGQGQGSKRQDEGRLAGGNQCVEPLGRTMMTQAMAKNTMYYNLVGGLEYVLFAYIFGIIIPIA